MNTSSPKSLIIAVLSIFSFSCNNSNDVPYKYKVTAIFDAGNTNQSLELTDGDHRVTAVDQLNVNLNKIFIKAQILEGSGTQPSNGWIAMSFKKNVSVSGGGGFSHSNTIGNYTWLLSHSSELMIASRLTGPAIYFGNGYSRSDSTVNADAGLHLFGSSYFVHLKSTDDFIPWHHHDVVNPMIDPACITSITANSRKCVDMQSITKTLFDQMAAVFNSLPEQTQDSPVKIELGGTNHDGNFKLYFIPHIQYKFGSPSNPDDASINSPGFGFYFEAQINVSVGIVPATSLRIIFPIFLLFDRSGTDVSRKFNVNIVPMHDIATGSTSPAGLDKIVITASSLDFTGIFNTVTAQITKDKIIEILKNRFSSQDASLAVLVDISLSLGINQYIKNPNRPFNNPDEIDKFDIVLIPASSCPDTSPMCFNYHGIYSTRVQPEDDFSTKIMALIIDDGK